MTIKMHWLKSTSLLLMTWSLMIPNHAMSQNKMSNNDPCFNDPQTTLCQEKIQRSIS